jgi:type VI secretion system protein ImpH
VAAESRRTDPPLEQQLFQEPYRFDFFQAVRLLERVLPGHGPVGQDTKALAEIVRLRAHNALTFPPSAIHDLVRADDGRPPLMTVAFMGLTGPSGVLPRHYTELILERARRKDRALPDFLDVFNHRMLSFFYRAWQKYRVPIAHEQAAHRATGEDPFTRSLFDHFGMGTPGLRGRLQVEDQTLLYYAGLLAQHPRSATALEGMLADYLAAPVRVVPFRGEWLPLSEDNRSRLGGGGREANNALGQTAVLGKRFWDQQARFRLRIGPIGLGLFCDLLPSGREFRALAQLTRLFVGQELDFDVQLVLRRDEVLRCRLGDTGPHAPRLGWSSWLRTKPFTRDADDAVLSRHLTSRGALPDTPAAPERRAA